MANDLLSIVNNKLLEEGYNSNLMARRQEMRRMMDSGDYYPDQGNATNTTATNPNTTGTQPTLAGVLATMGMGSGSGGSSNTNIGYNGSGSIPSWAPTAVNMIGGLTGNGLAGSLGSIGLNAAKGNYGNSLGGLASLFSSMASKGTLPSGTIGGLVRDLYNGVNQETMAGNALNSGLGYALKALNPALGLGYSLASLFGLNVARGLSDYSKSDSGERAGAGYHGGFFGNGSWTPTSVSGSGEGNISGPGTGSGYTPSSNPSGYDTGSAYGSTGYGSTTSTTTSESSGD